MMSITNDQVMSILTLVGSASYDKNLDLEAALSQNMLGSFLVIILTREYFSAPWSDCLLGHFAGAKTASASFFF